MMMMRYMIHGTGFGAIGILAKEPPQCATKLLHAHPDFTSQLAISTFSANARFDPTTAAAALSYSERLALAAVGRGTSRASNDHAAARFRAVGTIAVGGCGSRAEPSIRARAGGKAKFGVGCP